MPHHTLASDLSSEARRYLVDFRRRYSASDVVGFLDAASGGRVAVIGEAIIDEYAYVEPMGKSAKDAVIAVRALSQESQAGGAVAVANHAGAFANRVDLLTALGERESRDAFIREHLHEHVQPRFIYKAGSPTIVKRRFIDNYTAARLLEVYEFNDSVLGIDNEAAFLANLEELLPQVDVVVVADFGHGLISPAAARAIEGGARFLAVNAQTNSANLGFHTITKYQRADFVSIQEREIRLDRRDREGPLPGLLEELSGLLGTRATLVTRGKSGALLHTTAGTDECPSLAFRVVDRMGAGDAVFAVASLCVAAGVPADAVNFIANAVGAQAVTVVGNRTAVDREALERDITMLLTEVGE